MAISANSRGDLGYVEYRLTWGRAALNRPSFAARHLVSEWSATTVAALRRSHQRRCRNVGTHR